MKHISEMERPSTPHKYHQKNQSALNYIKAAAKKLAGVFSTLVFLTRPTKTASKGAPATPDGSRNYGQPPGISLFMDISTGSNNKRSSRFKYSDSYGSSNAASGQLVTENFSIEEINKATQNFSQANKIGEGGFGTVYKGRLGNGSLVAIKRAKKNMYDKRLSQEFKNEILTLSRIEHLNLVKLLGYLEHKDERIIIIEYIGNGTLREHLDGTQGLEIAERLDIAIDVAHAVAYLHMYTDTPIIHRDIKASNILITEKLRAKVADFGFARLAAEDPGATHISTQIKGTAGYLDPEYLRTYQLTEKSDVYSFGVLLVEMVTGRHPIESKRPLSERVTTRWAMERLKEGDAVLAMDPKLRRNPASNQAVERVLKLARQCLAPLRQSRPSMRKCAEVLWGIRKDFREKAFSYSPCPSSHRSDNFLNKDARKNRHHAFGLEDCDNYKFVSA
ncbi:Calmodulin-binding receptor-like cytoplasmic kinase 1 [Vitis vinifera]|uniref:non-specific serine/threonine protein kinase n=1 Tax=Vitis vinifera TaxID=29760 RepID=A0A438F8T5_VITVI|nr:Calmodulin-binding receptor-like cytoplasmic kinase 1 [Vitis vinifera]